MSRWGRAQDALHALYEVGMGPNNDPKPGIVQEEIPGITLYQWHTLVEPILHAVAPIFSDAPYNRQVLVDTLVYHYRKENSSCGCGWAELGRSHPEHVADVYEEAVKFHEGE